MTNRKIEYWVIPPKTDGEFVAQMEDVLDIHARPYNAECPVICMDEQPVQLHKEITPPIEATAKHPKRVDYEYERAGTASIFMFTEPLVGWRQATVRPRRTKIDWATEVAALMEGRYADCPKVVLTCDNLNTHTPAALYKTFAPDEALRILNHIQFHYTPKHGSWLNMVECEFSVLSRQCLNRRIPDFDLLAQEVTAWEEKRNSEGATVNWLFKVEDARTKLANLYPDRKSVV